MLRGTGATEDAAWRSLIAFPKPVSMAGWRTDLLLAGNRHAC
jgi:hypothetical protein